MSDSREAKVIEFRAATEECGPEADIRIVSYGVVDSYGTSWAPGVFKRSAAVGSIPAVFSHDADRPIGVVHNFRDDGQHLDGTLSFLDFAACPDARLAYEVMKRGAYPGISFAFTNAVNEEDREHRGALKITSADMIEVSTVLRAAVPGSRPLAIRSALSPSVVLSRVPHGFEGQDVCTRCDGVPGNSAHTRSMDTVELRELTAQLAATPVEEANQAALAAAANIALDSAISIANNNDFRSLPPWVSQFLALVMTADAMVDKISDVDNTSEVESTVRALDIKAPETRAVDPEMIAMLDKLNRMSKKGK